MACVSLALGATSLAAADQALIVGVQEYSPLVSASTLRGCLNDANAIADVLRKNGFSVKLLTNQQATKSGILQSLAELTKSTKRDERFVFYFAGHGRRLPHPALMPHDATSEGNDITTDDLNASILKIPARSRTVILDACFSGGMAAGEMARDIKSDDLVGRYWEPPAEQSRSLTFGPPKTPVNAQDNAASKLDNGTGICYYTAATANEQALEGSFDGQRHGLFTYALLNSLKEEKKPWAEVHNGVKTQMQTKLQNSGRQQNPMISKDYMNAVVLDNNKEKPVPPKPTKSLLEIWNLDNPDPKKLLVELNPNDAVYEAGRKLKMTVNVGVEGYLLILGQVGGRFYQIYPSGKYAPEDALVKAGKLNFPAPGDVLFFDEFGADQIKAILLPSPEKAKQVMEAMRQAAGESEIGTKELVMTRSLAEPEYTSRVSISVSDKVIGGARLKNIDALIRRIGAQADPVALRVWDLMGRVATYSKAKQWMADTDFNQPVDLRSRQQFVTLLNLVLQDLSIYDEAAFAKVKLSKKTLDLLKKNPKGEDLQRLNRMLLAEAFPQEVNSDEAAAGK